MVSMLLGNDTVWNKVLYNMLDPIQNEEHKQLYKMVLNNFRQHYINTSNTSDDSYDTHILHHVILPLIKKCQLDHLFDQLTDLLKKETE